MPDHEIQELEHTADWAIRVRARDERSLFVGAAQGMFGLLTDLSCIAPERSFGVALQAIDVETLLIDWLNELLYLSEAHAVVFCEFAVDSFQANDGARLQAHVRGGRPAELLKHIKAATFSSLSIERDGQAIQAELVFDV